MLTLERVRLRWEDFTLLADATVPAGGVTAVMGPSGGGKSTLLALIGGFVAPDSGRILIGGSDVTRLPPDRRPVAILFQDNNLFPHLTVAQNVGLGLAPRLRLSDPERAQVAAVLGRVGLTGFEDRKPGALSGGQQSRAALARALLQNRPLVLLDEPFAALGPGLRAEMLDLAREILAEAGRTLLMVTHAPEDAARVADQVLLVQEGVVSGPFATGPLLADPPPALRAYLGG